MLRKQPSPFLGFSLNKFNYGTSNVLFLLPKLAKTYQFIEYFLTKYDSLQWITQFDFIISYLNHKESATNALNVSLFGMEIIPKIIIQRFVSMKLSAL